MERLAKASLSLVFATSVLFSMSVFGQSPGGQFVLHGKINIDKGEVYLMPRSAESSYYPAGTMFHGAAISKGKFVISGPWPQPSVFMLRVDVDSVGKYVSDYFIVNSGVQEITCNVDSLREIPGIENKYMGEFKNLETAYEALATGRGEFLLSYARAHPGSFIVLWGLIGELTGGGYEPVLDSAYHSLSVAVRTSFAGKVFAQKMAKMRAMAVGGAFPELALLDTNLNKVNIVAASRRNKYVLVDFWDSHCGPCIGEFAELKKIYQENGPYGFTIVAVSIDDKKDIKSWKKVIREHRLPWPQYLDLGGQASGDFVKLLPTKFLLDSKGKIVKRNPDLKSLSIYLKEHIQ